MNVPFRDQPQDENRLVWHSGKLWSLWDMINFNLRDFCTAIDMLWNHASRCGVAALGSAPSELEKSLILSHLRFISAQCDKLSLEKAKSRIIRARVLEMWCTNKTISEELSILLEAIEDDIKEELFYHYPKEKGLMVSKAASEWAGTIKSFPSTACEIDDAVDSYGLGHLQRQFFI